MLRTGLVSVTFRRFEAKRIIEIAAEKNLQGIEWGGDVHVPPDDYKNAEKVGVLTREAGLETAAYGSYFRLGSDRKFENVLHTAVVLQTKMIRVWAGETGSISAADEYRKKIIDETKRICDQAAEKEISVVYEFHGNTLNDQAESCLDLLKSVDRPNLKTYWQPQFGKNVAENLQDIDLVFPFIAGIHVFHWDMEKRLKLSEGQVDWRSYFYKLKKIKGYALLEFVKNYELSSFLSDAQALKRLVYELNHEEC